MRFQIDEVFGVSEAAGVAARTALVARGEREAEAADGGPEPGPACVASDRRKKL
jgi:hypothetical protein